MTAILAPAPALDRESITRLMHAFYGGVRADALLGPVFEPRLHDHWEAHLARMADFWCAAMKVERGFRGDVYAAHMAIAGVTRRHVGRWLWLWRRDTTALMAPEAAERLQHVAIGIARVLDLGWSGTLPTRAQVLGWIDDAQPAQPSQTSAGLAS